MEIFTGNMGRYVNECIQPLTFMDNLHFRHRSRVENHSKNRSFKGVFTEAIFAELRLSIFAVLANH